MPPTNGFHLLADELNPTAVRDILGWRDHPELSRLVTKLLSHTSRKAFLDSYAEAMVARHLVARGCVIRCEVPTPQGRRSDFEVTYSGQSFFAHVKRVDTDLQRHNPKQMRAISARLRTLERIARPYIVQVRWNERVTAAHMQELVNQAQPFIERARVGDEMIARDSDGRHIGGVRIIAPWDGEHVSIAVGLRGGFVDQQARFGRMLDRAYQQFMPRAVNVMLICSDHMEDVADFENALLGSHVERWDAFPPRGKRVAHGRADDGFWQANRVMESRHATWFQFSPEEQMLNTRLWVRRSQDDSEPITALLRELFEGKSR